MGPAPTTKRKRYTTATQIIWDAYHEWPVGTWYERLAAEAVKSERVRFINARQSDRLYLTRFNIVGDRCGIGQVVLHLFSMSDDDAGYHDHPWAFATAVLAGGYWEHRPPETIQWRAPGSVQVMPPNHLHRVVLDPVVEEPVWTMGMMGPHIREWGFVPLEGGAWAPWKEYLKVEKSTEKEC